MVETVSRRGPAADITPPHFVTYVRHCISGNMHNIVYGDGYIEHSATILANSWAVVETGYDGLALSQTLRSPGWTKRTREQDLPMWEQYETWLRARNDWLPLITALLTDACEAEYAKNRARPAW